MKNLYLLKIVCGLILGIVLAACSGDDKEDVPNCAEGEEWNSSEEACKRILPTEWTCLDDIGVPLRLNENNDVECMSKNDKDCLWTAANECQNTLTTNNGSTDLKPLSCGDEHKEKWGSTGYDNPQHWCAKAQPQL